MAVAKMADFTFKHADYPDKPSDDSATIKAKFDSRATEIRTYINDTLTPEVDSKVSSSEITNLAGAGRTTETVKANADAIAALTQHQRDIQMLVSMGGMI